MEGKQGVGPGDSRPKTPIDPEAYEAYIKARVYALDRDILRARSAYDLALQRSADFAPARAGLALTLLLEGQSPNDLARPKEAVPEARDLAKKALESDGTLGDAYCVLANIAQTYDYNPAEAERLYQEAMRVDPSNMTAHEWYGNYFMIRNHMDEAEREVNKGRQLDPAAPLLNTQVAEIKYYRRQYDAALQLTEKILEGHPNFVYARLWKASALREQKRYVEALKEFEELRHETNNSPASIALQGHALGVSGDRAGALKSLHELEALQATRYVPSLYIAGIYLGLNDRKATMAKLKEAYQERYDRLVYINVDPMADSLHGDAEFEQLMQKVGVK
jgi:Tfp pilus assembly protein PilF